MTPHQPRRAKTRLALLEINPKIEQLLNDKSLSKRKKTEMIADLYMHVGLTHQVSVRRAHKIVDLRVGGVSARPIQKQNQYIDLYKLNESVIIDNHDAIQEKEIKRRFAQTEIRTKQWLFRKEILKAYHESCAISECKVKEILTAAHIIPHAERINYHVTNGICMRIDFHALFDSNLIWIDSEYIIHISSKIEDAYYARFNNTKLRTPLDANLMPSKDLLKERQKRFTRS